MLLLLLALFQELQYIAGLGNLGEIDLGLDLRRRYLFFGHRT